MNLGTALVAVRADIKDLRKDLDTAKRETAKATEAMQSRAESATKTFRAMWLAYAAGAAVVASTAMKAIKAASDLQETTNKFNVVFKGQQEVAEGWAKTLTNAYSMSTREAKAHLSSIQDLLVPMGMAADAAGKLSFEIVRLAADLGSFNNLPTEQVMLDVQSALVGNFETMKKYGVVLNAANVKQEALNMGLVTTVKELDAAQKAQAAYSLIVKGSQAAIGDNARSVGSYAKSLKDAKAAWEDFMAELGKTILPAATIVLNWVSEWLRDFLYVLDELKKIRREMKGLPPVPYKQFEKKPIPGAGPKPPPPPPAPFDFEGAMKWAATVKDIEDVEAELFSTRVAQQEYIQDQNRRGIELARIGLETEREITEERQNMIGEALEAEMGMMDEWGNYYSQKSQEQMRWDTIVAQHKMQTTQMWVNAAVMALHLFGQKNKAANIAAIAIQTAFAMFTTFASTKAAAMRALAELGPIAGAPVAAAIESYGAASMAAIAAMGVMQGAAVATASTGAGSILTPQGEAALTSPGVVAPGEGRATEIHIHFDGGVITDKTFLEDLADRLSQLVEGDEVRLISSEVRAT